jgi:predicted amidohydrolase
MIGRAVENTIYFASVNNAMRFQESATSVIGPEGECIAHLPYGVEGLLICEVDLSRATGFYATRLGKDLAPCS